MLTHGRRRSMNVFFIENTFESRCLKPSLKYRREDHSKENIIYFRLVKESIIMNVDSLQVSIYVLGTKCKDYNAVYVLLMIIHRSLFSFSIWWESSPIKWYYEYIKTDAKALLFMLLLLKNENHQKSDFSVYWCQFSNTCVNG